MSANLKDKDFELEQVCPECIKLPVTARSSCQYCAGNGVIPSEFGKRVLTLLDHNFPRIANQHIRVTERLFG